MKHWIAFFLIIGLASCKKDCIRPDVAGRYIDQDNNTWEFSEGVMELSITTERNREDYRITCVHPDDLLIGKYQEVWNGAILPIFPNMNSTLDITITESGLRILRIYSSGNTKSYSLTKE